MTQSNPLVSIVVATFNSSSTIIETLDSIAAQTYRNIELIVTDDCSKDNTVEKVQKWDIQNRNIFVDCKIITHPINTGVSPNFNRGVLASSGIWVKTIAGDDTFRPDAIQKYVEYVLSHNSIMCVCDLNLFSEVDVPQRLRNFYKSYIEMIDVPQEEQYRDVLSYQHFAGPGYFYLRKVYDEIGGFDERYNIGEEWPFVFKILSKGYRIDVIRDTLINYRISSNSLCRNNTLGSYALYKNDKDFFYDFRLKAMIKERMFLQIWDCVLDFWGKDFRYYTNNSSFSRYVSKFLRFLSPIRYKRHLSLGK